MRIIRSKQYGIDVSIRVYFSAIILFGISNWYMINVVSRFDIFPYSAGIFMNLHWVFLIFFMYFTHSIRKSGKYNYSIKLSLIIGYTAFLLFQLIFARTDIAYITIFILLFTTAQYDLMFYDYSGSYILNNETRLYYYIISIFVYIVLFLLGNIGFIIAVVYRRLTRDIFLTKVG